MAAALRSPSASGRFSTLRSRGYMTARTMCCPARNWRQRSRNGRESHASSGASYQAAFGRIAGRAACAKTLKLSVTRELDVPPGAGADFVKRVARTVTLLSLLAACAGTHGATLADAPNSSVSTGDFPTKPVRIIEPFGMGGGPDLLARALAPELSKLWGQPVTVENHPGAGATAAPGLVAKSRADGYTLLLNTSSQAYSAVLSKTLPYDPLNDFIPTASLTSQPYLLVASKLAGVTTVGELVAAAKAKPGELKFASTGLGTATHLSAVKFNFEAGIKAVEVLPRPSDSIADVLAGTIEGRTAYMFAPISITLPPIHDGRLLPLGVSTTRR